MLTIGSLCTGYGGLDLAVTLRPGAVVLENVAGHLSLGFDVVVGDLAEIGYDVGWSIVRASDVGACHQRARLYIVATDPARVESYVRSDGNNPAHRRIEGIQEPPRGSDSPAVDWHPYDDAIRRHAALVGRPAPDPVDGIGVNPRFAEWMMCLPNGWVTDVLPRIPALKALGNGVVPPQAAHAITGLLDRFDTRLVDVAA